MATYSSSLVARSFSEKGDLVSLGVTSYDFKIISATPIVTELSGFIKLDTLSMSINDIKGDLVFADPVAASQNSGWRFTLPVHTSGPGNAFPNTAVIKDFGTSFDRRGPYSIKTPFFNYYIDDARSVVLVFQKFICPPGSTLKILRFAPFEDDTMFTSYNLTFVEFSET